MSDLRVVPNIIMQIKQRNELILPEGAGKSFWGEAFKEWIQTLPVEKEKSIYNERHDTLQWWFFWKVSYLVGTTTNEAWKLPWASWVLEVELCSVCSGASDLSDKLWTIHGIEPKFLSAAHRPFAHRVIALPFSKPFSHQSWGNPTLQSPTLMGLCTPLTFACADLKLLVSCCISFTLSSSVIFFVKSSHLPSHYRDGVGTVKCSAFPVWGGWASLSQPGLDLALTILTSAFLPFQWETNPSGSNETQQDPSFQPTGGTGNSLSLSPPTVSCIYILLCTSFIVL